LISKGSNTRYLDNNLWVTLDNELQNPQVLLQDGKIGAGDVEYVGSDDEGDFDAAGGMLLNTISMTNQNLADLFPTPAQQTVLWQVSFRIHPLVVGSDSEYRYT
jgi:hypothetical protein